MALHSADEGKLIFAPTGTSAVTRAPAEQFTQHELLGLRRADLDPHSPIAQFHAWFTAAQQSSPRVRHPETCTLSTASLPSGRVSARVVYMKELDARGFVVYSNFGTSRKAADLASNPWAALTFWWEGLERQVRVEGRAERLPREESQAYFDTRARASRVGAWASRQSQVLRPVEGGDGDDDGRAQLEGWVREAEERFAGKGHVADEEGIPVPEFWGGLRIVPERVEFWQGRASRLHDRFVYDRVEGKEGEWTLERLSP
ncbi:Pyridoxamine 5'-phosphate oxidase [Pleurostoma richardsiae]|uniref:pyridoxal 5'-phosphate synthase n=1 Tax=Pleurostoma richardsiae TaxID=41990 RepID=A0AA38R9Q1_9PEZI|nr:Pyridoxamine 5'-phosphate oxidase [Pleurostoma richardsiae]